jgi:predicted nucleotidyltransferase
MNGLNLFIREIRVLCDWYNIQGMHNFQDFGEQLGELAGRYDLVAVYAFGSRSKEILARLDGEAVDAEFPDSDVDIGVLPDRRRGLRVDERVALMLALEDIFKVKRVDLVVLPDVPPFLALDIVRGELLYTSDADAEAEYQLYVLAHAGDLAGWDLERRRMLLAGEAF